MDVCHRCGEPLSEPPSPGAGAGRCVVCGSPPRTRPDPDGGDASFEAVIHMLPSFLAWNLETWRRESPTQPFSRLWRLVDSVETLVRYLLAAAIGEVRRLGGGALPEEFSRRLRGEIERPTLGGTWRVLRDVAEEAGAATSPLIAGVRPLVQGLLRTVVEGPSVPRRPETSVLALRNEVLAHGLGTSPELARRYLVEAGHEARARRLFAETAEALSTHRLWYAFVDGRIAELRGLSPRVQDPEALPAGAADARRRGPGLHLVIEGTDVPPVDLAPILDFGPPERLVSPPDVGPAPAPEVYLRATPTLLRYVILDDSGLIEERPGAPLDRFRDCFGLHRPRATAVDSESFRAEIESEAENFVGRSCEVERVVEALARAEGGVYWIGGKAGAGKSAFLARVATDPRLKSDPRRFLVFLHRFRSGDGRCNRSAMRRGILHALAGWPPLSGLAEEVMSMNLTLDGRVDALLDGADRLEAHRGQGPPPRVIIFLDGLDEIARSEPRVLKEVFPRGGPGGGADGRSNVVWVCAGRDEGQCLLEFPPDRCTHLFPRNAKHPEGGLPPLSPGDVRAFLLHASSTRRYDLLRCDQDEAGKVTPRNRFVDEVVRLSGGSPLYVSLVIDDLVGGRWMPEDIGAILPPTLTDYYRRFVGNYTLSIEATIKPFIVALLAVFPEPLPEEIIAAFLVSGRRLSSPEGAQVRVSTALAELGGVLAVAACPGGGPGLLLAHDTFRRFVLDSPEMNEVVKLTRDDVRGFVFDRERILPETVRTLVSRAGVDLMLEQDRAADALNFAGNPARLRECASSTEGTGMDEVLAEFSRIFDHPSATMAVRAQAGEWVSFFARVGRILRRGPTANPLLLEALARSEKPGSVVRKAFEAGSAPGKNQGPSGFVRLLPAELHEGTKDVLIEPVGLRPRALLGLNDNEILVGGEGPAGPWVVYDTSTGLKVPRSPVSEVCAVHAATQLPDGRIVTTGADDALRVWDRDLGVSKRIPGIVTPKDEVAFLAASGDGQHVLLLSRETGCRIVTLAAGTVRAIPIAEWSVRGGVSPVGDGDFVVATRSSPRIVLVSASSRRVRVVWNVVSLRSWWRRTRGMLARIWNLLLRRRGPVSSPLPFSFLEEFLARVTAFADLGGGRVAVALDTKPVRIAVFDVLSGAVRADIRTTFGEITCLRTSSDRHTVVAGAEDGEVAGIDVETRTVFGRRRLHTGMVRNVVVLGDGRVATRGDDGLIRISRLEGAPAALPGSALGGSVTTLVPLDGELLASAGEDPDVRIWSSVSGTCISVLPGTGSPIRALVCMSGRRLLAIDHAGFTVWDTRSAQRISRTRFRFELWSMGRVPHALSEDGVLILRRFGLERWDVARGRILEGVEDPRTVPRTDDRLREIQSLSGTSFATITGSGSVELYAFGSLSPRGRISSGISRVVPVDRVAAAGLAGQAGFASFSERRPHVEAAPALVWLDLDRCLEVTRVALPRAISDATVTSRGTLLTVDSTGVLSEWAAFSKQPRTSVVSRFGVDFETACALALIDDRTAAVGTFTGGIYAVDLATGGVRAVWHVDGWVEEGDLVACGGKLAVATRSGEVVILVFGP